MTREHIRPLIWQHNLHDTNQYDCRTYRNINMATEHWGSWEYMATEHWRTWEIWQRHGVIKHNKTGEKWKHAIYLNIQEYDI